MNISVKAAANVWNSVLVLAAGLGLSVSAWAQPAGTLTVPASPATSSAPGNTHQPGNAPVAPIPVPEGSPLTFTTTLHDFGKIPDTAPVSFPFKFKNVSDKPVKIIKVNASCGCTTTKHSDVVQPGEESEIVATFNPAGRSGRETKSITVEIDHPTVKNIFLTAVAYVQKAVIIEPQNLFMGEVPFGKGAVQEVSISGRDPNFTVMSATLENPNLVLEEMGSDTVSVEGDTLKRYKYRVTLKTDAPKGPITGSVVFKTSDAKMPNQQCILMGAVVGPIRVMPERMPLRYAGPGEAFVGEVQLEPRERQGFKVLSVSLDDAAKAMNVVLDVVPATGGSRAMYRVRVAGTTPANFSDARGSIIIRTDNAEMGEIVVPFTAIQMGNASMDKPGMGGSRQGRMPMNDVPVKKD